MLIYLLKERKEIELLLNNERITLKQIASILHRSPKCIRYEITHHRKLIIRANQINKCGKQNVCEIHRLCPHCVSALC
ncbi:MAG: helix-turn-helix domain-containing protein [Solobacterium sp.]|nr:helix-turn-helix domain-containing protein [Solobacterium sp.]